MSDDVGVERLGDEAPDVGQRLGRLPAALAQLVHAGVPDRDRGGVGESGEESELHRREGVPRVRGERQSAEHLTARDEGQDDD